MVVVCLPVVDGEMDWCMMMDIESSSVVDDGDK